MNCTADVRRIGLVGMVTASILLLALTGCTESVHVAWTDTQSIIEPAVIEAQVLLPEGTLEVYSERYVRYHGDVPRMNRRSVEVYTVDGQLAAREKNPFGEGPIRFTLSPGHYIVVSKSYGQWRRVQVAVQDRRETVVTESHLAQAPLAAPPRPARTT